MLKVVLGLAFLVACGILLLALRPKRGVAPGFMDSDGAAMVGAMVLTSLLAAGLALCAIAFLSN
jgi:hypothetical protein